MATSQEEIGVRGATGSGYSVDPQVALVVDVGHATDHPDCDNRKYGETKLERGAHHLPGPNINPKVYEGLVRAAKKLKIPYQVESDPRPTGTDARSIQIARGGRRNRPCEHPPSLHAHAERGRGPRGRGALREAVRRIRQGRHQGRLRHW